MEKRKKYEFLNKKAGSILFYEGIVCVFFSLFGASQFIYPNPYFYPVQAFLNGAGVFGTLLEMLIIISPIFSVAGVIFGSFQLKRNSIIKEDAPLIGTTLGIYGFKINKKALLIFGVVLNILCLAITAWYLYDFSINPLF